MREIKFRAWDNENKSMIYNDFDINLPYHIDAFGAFEDEAFLKRFIPLQFTGLIDKNGVEVYEGDIIKYIDDDGEKGISEVDWHMIGGWGILLNVGDCEFEVIGNIYENKELLK